MQSRFFRLLTEFADLVQERLLRLRLIILDHRLGPLPESAERQLATIPASREAQEELLIGIEGTVKQLRIFCRDVRLIDAAEESITALRRELRRRSPCQESVSEAWLSIISHLLVFAQSEDCASAPEIYRLRLKRSFSEFVGFFGISLADGEPGSEGVS